MTGYTLTRQETEAVRWAASETGSLYEEYSGRGMYGATCFGVTGPTSVLGRFLVALRMYDEHVELCEGLAEAATHDDLGLGSIWYFPGFRLNDGQHDDEEA